MFLERWYSRFGNFDSVVPDVDVIRVKSYTSSDHIVRQTIYTFIIVFITMNNNRLFHEIDLKYGHAALRLICRHRRCSRKVARYANHLTFLTRCIKNHIVPKDLQIRPPVPTKGGRRVAEVASMRFLGERIRLTQRARKDVKKKPSPQLRA